MITKIVHWYVEECDPENGPTGELNLASGEVLEEHYTLVRVRDEEGRERNIPRTWLAEPEQADDERVAE